MDALEMICKASQVSRQHVERLIDQHPGLLEAPDERQRTPLMRAASFRLIPEMRVLLDLGADIHAVDPRGATALHWAARDGGDQVVPFLLSRGARANVKDRHGWTPLMLSAQDYRLVAVRSLLKVEGLDIDATNHRGETALHHACLRGCPWSIRDLLRAGADHTIVDMRGRTARDIAEHKGPPGCAEAFQVCPWKYVHHRAADVGTRASSERTTMICCLCWLVVLASSAGLRVSRCIQCPSLLMLSSVFVPSYCSGWRTSFIAPTACIGPAISTWIASTTSDSPQRPCLPM